ncbi:MAG TPA: hypothetical protein VEA16_00715, partial [Vicinamibacterales bacterium]|nr:hypothetical protein [Vicinamibacterales bacterium]
RTLVTNDTMRVVNKLLIGTTVTAGAANPAAIIANAGWYRAVNGAGTSTHGLMRATAGNDAEFAFNTNYNLASFSSSLTDALADGDYGLLLLGNHGGTVTQRRVKVGAADSGGAGFRMLRVSN